MGDDLKHYFWQSRTTSIFVYKKRLLCKYGLILTISCCITSVSLQQRPSVKCVFKSSTDSLYVPEPVRKISCHANNMRKTSFCTLLCEMKDADQLYCNNADKDVIFLPTKV